MHIYINISFYVLPGKRAFCDCILFLSQSRDGCTSKLKRRDMNVFVIQSTDYTMDTSKKVDLR